MTEAEYTTLIATAITAGIDLLVIIIVFIKYLIRMRKIAGEGKIEKFKSNFDVIWKNYKEYYKELIEFYNIKNTSYEIFCDNEMAIKDKPNHLLMVDNILKNKIESVEQLKELNDVKVKYINSPNITNAFNINKKILPNSKETFLKNYEDYYCKIPLRNNDTYYLYEYKDGVYKVYMDGYNKYIESGLYLEYDLSFVTPNTIRSSTLRNHLDLLNFKNRNVGIGVCTLTVFKHVYNKNTKKNEDAYFLLHNRSNNLTEHPSQKSIVPAGTFEPINSIVSDEDNLNFSNTVYREFAEEILGQIEFEELHNTQLIDETLKAIKDASKIYYLGSGIDVLNGKLELLNILVIDALKIGSKYKKLDINDIVRKFTGNFEGTIKIKDFSLAMLKQYRDDVNCVPCAREIFSILAVLKENGVVF